MKKIFLTKGLTLLSLFISTELCAAECVNGFTNDENKYPCGTCNSDSTCLWTLDESGKMTISSADNSKVAMSDYSCDGYYCEGNRPWENYIEQITSLVVEDNIVSIGIDAFQSAHNLKSVRGMNDVKNLSNEAFAYCDSLQYIDMSNVTTIGKQAFYYAQNLTSVDMPNVSEIYEQAFYYATALQYVGLPVDKNGDPLNVEIADSAFEGVNEAVKNCTNKNRAACGNCRNNYIVNGIGCVNESQCNRLESYYFTGSECTKRPTDGTDIACEHEISGYVKVGNYCVSPENSYAKKHYTPAEAAQWLHDGNDNFVVITFKK